jgi:hypothetical protein|tara:strand:- start:125 stop:628 length:504 start_codon:yes stop_codon:yes gene_type:complete
MANGNNNFPDIFDRPIPGQSLTDEPKNYPWEHPPQFTDLREARDRIFDNLTEEEAVQQLLTMLSANVPAEAVVRTILFAGFTEGKFSVDTAILLAPVVLMQVVSIAKAAGIEKFSILMDEKPDDNFTKAMLRVSEDTGVKGVKKAAEKIKKETAPATGLMGKPEEKK